MCEGELIPVANTIGKCPVSWAQEEVSVEC